MAMMDSILPMLFYIFGIILFIVMTILGIRTIQILDRAEKVIDNVEDKVNTLNGFFNVINKATTGIDLISSKVVGTVVGVFEKIFRKRKEDDFYE